MRKIFRLIGSVVVAILPWRLKRAVYVYCYKWDVSRTAHVGLTIIRCHKVILRSGAAIGHLNLIRNCEVFELDENASIGMFNWISGFPLDRTGVYLDEVDRRPEFHMGRHAAIVSRHIIDCADCVTFGPFSVLGGYRSCIYTHTANLALSRVSCAPVTFGAYSFVGTECTVLPGGALPDYSVLTAKSLLRTKLETRYVMYGGVPATPIRELDKDMAYFHRTIGVLWPDSGGHG